MIPIEYLGPLAILSIAVVFIAWVFLAIQEARSGKKPAAHKKKKKNEPALLGPGPKGFVWVQYPGQPATMMSEEHARACGLLKGKEPEQPRRSAYGVKW